MRLRVGDFFYSLINRIFPAHINHRQLRKQEVVQRTILRMLFLSPESE